MTSFLITCENATCAVPEAHRELFRGSEDVVASTEGWEPGALNLAQGFAMKFRTPLVHADVTRLLIDFEKDGDERWSRFSEKLPEATRAKLADRHVRQYRLLLNNRIADDLKRHARVLHLMVHTEPGDDGRVTLATFPGGAVAEQLATAWRIHLTGHAIDARQHPNSEPTALAAELAAPFTPDRYVQIKLSVSQGFFLEGRPLRWETLKKILLESLIAVVADLEVAG